MNPRAVNYNQVPMVPVINQNAQVMNGQMMNQQIRNGQMMNQQIGNGQIMNQQIRNGQIRNNQQNVRNNLNNIYKIASIDKNRQDEEWTVCLEKLSSSSMQIMSLRCKHYFHKECIDEWVKRNQTCPAWRKDVAGESDDEASIPDEDERPDRNERLLPRLRTQNLDRNAEHQRHSILLNSLDSSRHINDSEP